MRVLGQKKLQGEGAKRLPLPPTCLGLTRYVKNSLLEIFPYFLTVNWKMLCAKCYKMFFRLGLSRLISVE